LREKRERKTRLELATPTLARLNRLLFLLSLYVSLQVVCKLIEFMVLQLIFRFMNQAKSIYELKSGCLIYRAIVNHSGDIVDIHPHVNGVLKKKIMSLRLDGYEVTHIDLMSDAFGNRITINDVL